MVARPALPTVREMGRLALPLGSRLVSGSLGLGRPVRWARTSGVLSPLFPVLNADEVALIDLAQVQASNPSLTLARVVREFGRISLAAIVVLGEVDDASRRESERAGLPLFVLPEGSAVPRVARAIVRLVSDREAQEDAQGAALYRHLSQGVAGGLELEGLVGELHRLSNHAVWLTDLEGHRLAHAGRVPETGEELSRALYVGDSPCAVLYLRDRPEAMDPFSLIALEQGAAALTLQLDKLDAVEAAREGAHGDLITALIVGDDDVAFAARARAAEYPLDAVQWVVLAVAGAASEGTMREWMSRANSLARHQGWECRLHLGEGAWDGSTTVGPEPQWQVTLLAAGGGARWSAPRGRFLEAVREGWPAGPPLSLAAGEPGTGIAGLRQALTQARDALSLGLRLFGAGRLYLHREMGLYRLLRHLHGTPDLPQFLDRTLASLQAYDREHGTELVPTLRSLLDHGGNASATAKSLHLHRNSLAYRLERIREISGLDPSRPDDAFTMRLALMLAPLR